MKTTAKCLIALSLLLLAFTLVSTQAHAQQRESKPAIDSAAPIDESLEAETKVRYFYTDKDGKKKYVSNGKTQKMWSMILTKCPQCIDVAEEFNVNIYQNKKYIKKSTTAQ